MIKLIVFDWDDVFTLGAKEAYFNCYQAALMGVGVNMTSDNIWNGIIAKWSKSHREVLKELLKKNLEKVDKASKIYEAELFSGRFIESLKIVDGSIDLLEKLNHKYRLAVATGADPRILIGEVFPKFGVPDVFCKVMHTEEIDDPEKHKPHPYMLEEIIKNQQVLQSETIYVGDARTDVLMAQAAGVTPIVVLTGQLNGEQAKALGVKHIIKEVTNIESVLSIL